MAETVLSSTLRLFGVMVCVSVFLALAGGAAAHDAPGLGRPGVVAIMGYDPVAYFADGVPRKGSPDISQKWLGATWYFANAEHRAAFIAQPVRFTPQYGGFCALGMSVGTAWAGIDPEAWRIVNGKLYLFSDKDGLEKDFDANADEVIARADARWPQVMARQQAARGGSR